MNVESHDRIKRVPQEDNKERGAAFRRFVVWHLVRHCPLKIHSSGDSQKYKKKYVTVSTSILHNPPAMSFFAKLQGSDSESSSGSDSEESILSGSEGERQDKKLAAQKKQQKSKASMFLNSDESESEEESSDEDEEEMSDSDDERQVRCRMMMDGRMILEELLTM